MTEATPTEPTAPDPPPTDQPAPQLPPNAGPPGSTVFSLDQRPGAGLYFVGWLFCGAAAALLLLWIMSGSPVLLLLALLTAVVGLPAAASYQILARAGRPSSAYRGPSPLILFLLAIVVVNGFGIAIAAIAGISGLAVDRPEVFLLGFLVQVGAYVGVVWLFVIRSGALSWADLVDGVGPRRRERLAAVGTGIGVMACVAIVALILGAMAAVILDAAPPQIVPPPQSLADVLSTALAVVVIAPLGEELFFRGYSLTAWWRDLGPRSALIRSSLFFAIVHSSNVLAQPGQPDTLDLAVRQVLVLMVVLLPVGFVLGALFVRRGLVGSIAGHMTYNAVMFGLFLLSTTLPPPVG